LKTKSCSVLDACPGRIGQVTIHYCLFVVCVHPPSLFLFLETRWRGILLVFPNLNLGNVCFLTKRRLVSGRVSLLQAMILKSDLET
jgi:hypothetical protein